MKPYILFIYGDSLSMPRSFDGINCDKTYPEMIRTSITNRLPGRDVFFYNRSQGGLYIEKIRNIFQSDCHYFGNFGEKVLIFQCGIVDCAPRPIPKFLKEQLAKLPGSVRSPIVSFLHQNRSRILKSGLRWRATTPSRFISIYRKCMDQASREFSRVYILNILPTTENIEKHSPGLSESIMLYNDLILKAYNTPKRENLFLIDVNKSMNESNSPIHHYVNYQDGHHLTSEGHRLCSELVLSYEQSFIVPKNTDSSQ